MTIANQEEDGIEELMFADDVVIISDDQGRCREMVKTGPLSNCHLL